MNDATLATPPVDDDFISPAERAARSTEPTHLALARELIEARVKRDETKAAKTAAEKEFDAAQFRLNEYMVQHAMEPFRCEGHSVGVSFETRVNVLADNRVALAEALRDNGFGALVRDELRIDDEQLEHVQQMLLDLGVEGAVETTPTVHPSRLKSFVTEVRKDNNGELPAWLEGLVNVYDQPTINLRKVT